MLHDQAIVIDGACHLLEDPAYIDWYREGGVTVVAPTVGGTQSARMTLPRLATWLRLIAMRPELTLVRIASDIERAKSSGQTGVFLHLQGTDPIEDQLDFIDLYKQLGVGVIQLTYNVKNRVGDGCDERTDAGLSKFGVKLVRRLNEAKVVVDCAHTGLRTSLDALDVSAAPVIVSHANARALHPHARNVDDPLIKAVARSGGTIGISGFPAFISPSDRPTLDQMIAHIDHVAQLVGVDHVSIGTDYYAGQAGIATDEDAMKMYRGYVHSGQWSPESYPPPPYHYPAGIETPRTLFKLGERLRERGYSVDDVRKVMGGNLMRVFRSVWG